jgi:hypothetical protein
MEINPKGDSKDNDMDKKSFNKIMDAVSKTISETDSKPEFILYLGDMVGHEGFIDKLLNRSKFVKSIEKTYFKKILKNNPDTPIINVFGNNDSLESNYGKFEDDKVSPYTIAMDNGFKDGFLSTGIKCDKGNVKQVYPCIVDEDAKNGFFSISLKKNLILLGMNSVMFSPHSAMNNKAAFEQMTLLDRELKLADKNNTQVLIAMHIAAGNNVYDGSHFWVKDDYAEFLHLLSIHKRVVKGILTGHTLMEEFKVLDFSGTQIGEYFTAGLSTTHGNSPSFKIFNMAETDGKWSIDDYTTYQTHNTKGDPIFTKYYSFASTYCDNIKYKKDINNCLYGISFEDILPKYTVGNPNNKNYVAKSPKDFIIKVDKKDHVIV